MATGVFGGRTPGTGCQFRFACHPVEPGQWSILPKAATNPTGLSEKLECGHITASLRVASWISEREANHAPVDTLPRSKTETFEDRLTPVRDQHHPYVFG